MPDAIVPRTEAVRLEALMSYEVLDTRPEDNLDRIVRIAAQLLNCPIALVSLVDKNRQWFKARYGLDATETPREAAFCAHAILDPDQPLIVPDATEDPRFRDNPLVTGAPDVRFYAGVPLVTPDGHALGTLCVIDTVPKDIEPEQISLLTALSHKVMTTLELRRVTRLVHAQAAAAEERLKRVIEASPTALVLVDGNGEIAMTNRGAEQVFGYGRADMKGRKIEFLMPERYRGAHPGHRHGFQADVSARAMGEGRPLFGLRRDGTEFPIEIGLNPVEIDGATMVLAGVHDITARRAEEQERERERRDLARSNADLEEFAHIASHDLKAPLRGIAHLVEWIAEDIGATASPETTENLALLRGRVIRLQTLQDGLLSYSRVGRNDAGLERVDIAEVVDDIRGLLAPPPGFAIRCEGPMPVLRTYRSPIHVVLENLIGNAVKHRDRDDGTVVVSARQTGGLTEFRVSDDGPGIPPRFHDKVFVIFQTLASRDDVEASGIGLAVVKKKVETQGGSIRIESNPPARGTTFVFTWKDGRT